MVNWRFLCLALGLVLLLSNFASASEIINYGAKGCNVGGTISAWARLVDSDNHNIILIEQEMTLTIKNSAGHVMASGTHPYAGADGYWRWTVNTAGWSVGSYNAIFEAEGAAPKTVSVRVSKPWWNYLIFWKGAAQNMD
jgi:hypothetical protein